MFGLGEDVLSNAGQLTGNGNAIQSMEDWDGFAKAVQASSYQTDHATLTGMAAIRKESLESPLRMIVAQDDSFKFFRSLKRQPVTSAVHEYMIQTSRGGQTDGMNVGELDELQFDVGDYQRKVERLKLFATGAQISDFANAQGLEGETLRARENENALTRIANGVERALFVSNATNSPNKINGYFAQVDNWEGGKNVTNLNGLSDANELAQMLFQSKANARQEGVYGDVTDIWTDAYVQNDLDTMLFPQYRVQLDSRPDSVMLGAPVGGIRTSYGNIAINESIWMNNASNTTPAIVKNKGRMPDKVPATPTVTATPVGGPVPGSATGWTAGRAGVYYISVATVDADGREGIPSAPVSVTVAEAGAIQLDVDGSVSNDPATAARYYRSKQLDPSDPAPTLADLRLVNEFPLSGGKGTYVDVNQNIPGASNIPVMNKKPEAIQWLQLKPVTQFPLYATNKLVIPWAVVLYGTLMLGLPQTQFYYKGYLPKNANWKPFKA